MICELLFPSSILAVKLNRKTLVIVLENEIYIYDISNMRLQHVIETPPNPEGMMQILTFKRLLRSYLLAIVSLSPSADNSYLAYPSPLPTPSLASPSPAQPASTLPSTPTGDVVLFSTKSLTVTQLIRAHKTPLSALTLNSTGTLLATSSEKGTVIRVWSVPGAEKLYQFRRGTREAHIYSMNFNAVGTLLAVSSAHDTVHIFKLGPHNNANGSSTALKDDTSSPTPSIDSREGAGTMEGGYDAFIDGKRKGGMSCVSLGFLPVKVIVVKFVSRNSVRRRSLHLTKALTSSVGGYLPNTLTEMWEPSRDFAHLKLPTSGAKCIVAISGFVAHC
jgi:autophagy-related protein 18